MKKDKVEVVFVIDRSGSMQSGGRREEVISGFNKFITEQQKIDGECNVTFYRFDDEFDKVFEAKPLEHVRKITQADFVPRGTTALYDAIGRAINEQGARFAKQPKEEQPEKVFLIIITDGMENASAEFRREQIKEMIKEQEDKWNWSVLFLSESLQAYEDSRDYVNQKMSGHYRSMSKAMDNTTAFMSLARSTNLNSTLEDVKKDDD